MFGVLSRRMLTRAAGAARMNARRNMAHIYSEMPKKESGNLYLAGSIAFLVGSAAMVQLNGLVTWGGSPDMSAALKK